MNTISCNCGSLNFIPWKNDSILFNFFPLKTNSYGNKLDNNVNDVYVVTKDKHTVYYKKGFSSNDSVYYKAIED